MSGYVAVVRFDDRPIDERWCAETAEALRFRGPDRVSVVHGRRTAFMHALLATTPEAAREQQPLTIGHMTFCGDIRLDGRAELVRTLGASTETDPELVLLAHARWGERFIEQIIGDYSFVLYDARDESLLCVRDRFARRALFHAFHDGAVMVSNNLPSLLAVPALSGALDDAAIGDFLLFGRNLHAERTTFAAIRRLPAAHIIRITAEGSASRRYWSISERDSPRAVRPAQVEEEFRDVMGRAVLDRSRGDRVVLSLSGGLDSNTVGALLCRSRKEGVTALTTVWREMFDDQEGRYAALAAKSYGIPHHFYQADHCELFEGWGDARVRGLEPTDEPCSLQFHQFAARAAVFGRVILTGEGGDPALYTSHGYFFDLLRRFRWLRFVREAGHYTITRRKRPPLLLRSRLQRALGRRPEPAEYPTWLAPELEQRADLRERWEQVYFSTAPGTHPYRPEAQALLESSAWARGFEATEPGASGVALEWASPYFDPRVLEFLFSVPPMPHFADKDLVRRSMRGLIPTQVLNRPKTPLPTDPSVIRFQQAGAALGGRLDAAAGLGRYIATAKLRNEIAGQPGGQYRSSQQAFAVSLAIWLTHRQ